MAADHVTPWRVHPCVVDAHLHLDHVRDAAPERIAWLRQARCTCVSWAFAWEVRSTADLRAYLDAQQTRIAELDAAGLGCRFLAGVHPRNIPPDLRPEAVRELVLPRLEHALCLGIGEIGLETGSAREEEIFAAHLELWAEVVERGKVFGVHTPRSDKAARTEQVLGVLKRYPGLLERTVVDHCTPETIGEVLEAGYWVGVTLSPVKSSARDVEAVLARFPAARGRLLLNSDSGTEFYEDLHRFLRDESCPGDLREGLGRGNAERFFGLFAP